MISPVLATVALLASVSLAAGQWDKPSFCRNLECPVFTLEATNSDYEYRSYEAGVPSKLPTQTRPLFSTVWLGLVRASLLMICLLLWCSKLGVCQVWWHCLQDSIFRSLRCKWWNFWVFLGLQWGVGSCGEGVCGCRNSSGTLVERISRVRRSRWLHQFLLRLVLLTEQWHVTMRFHSTSPTSFRCDSRCVRLAGYHVLVVWFG